jgi:glucan phosphorylase
MRHIRSLTPVRCRSSRRRARTERGSASLSTYPGELSRCACGRHWSGASGCTLLDANDPVNSPADRGITGKHYDAGTEIRILQEIVLGVAGWRAVEALAPAVDEVMPLSPFSSGASLYAALGPLVLGA